MVGRDNVFCQKNPKNTRERGKNHKMKKNSTILTSFPIVYLQFQFREPKNHRTDPVFCRFPIQTYRNDNDDNDNDNDNDDL